jgi:mRNA interferase RelE/StbE
MTPEGNKSVYNIDLPKRVAKQLDKIPDRDYPSISRAIQNLKQTPRPFGSKKIHESLHRIRVGDYRVLYWVDDKAKTIVISKVERRGERTYRHL